MAISSLIRKMTSPAVVFYIMPYLMVLLVVGTLAQRNLGLYEAEQLYFASWIVWFGPIPLPGLYPALIALSVPLAVKLFFKSPWVKAQVGIIITHIGALFLLSGGMLTALTAEEGYIALGEGESIDYVSDYHLREFVILKNDEPLMRFTPDELEKGKVVMNADLPFALEMLSYCRHCLPVQQEGPVDAFRHIAKKFLLADAPLNTLDEDNQSGLIFRVQGAGEEADGTYIAYEPLPHPATIMVGDDAYGFDMRKIQRPLPFTVYLHEVEREVHPGTNTPREYQSIITVKESEDVQWKSAIRMNEPLRVMGYTLYQASFADRRGQEVSVLSVVKNEGRVFPYISSALMAIGLILHARIRSRAVRSKEAI